MGPIHFRPVTSASRKHNVVSQYLRFQWKSQARQKRLHWQYPSNMVMTTAINTHVLSFSPTWWLKFKLLDEPRLKGLFLGSDNMRYAMPTGRMEFAQKILPINIHREKLYFFPLSCCLCDSFGQIVIYFPAHLFFLILQFVPCHTVVYKTVLQPPTCKRNPMTDSDKPIKLSVVLIKFMTIFLFSSLVEVPLVLLPPILFQFIKFVKHTLALCTVYIQADNYHRHHSCYVFYPLTTYNFIK